MNGQLSEHPLAELIREINEKSLSGTLRLQHDRLKSVVYFKDGAIVYAAANAKPLRLREYLLASDKIGAEDLANIGDGRPDLDLGAALIRSGILSAEDVALIQANQVTDVIKLGVQWTEGTWEFDARSHLEQPVDIKVELGSVLLEASRHLPAEYVASRFKNPAEVISPPTIFPSITNLLPEEGFLLSRIDQPTGLHDLVVLSGRKESEALHLAYSLALAGLLQRERWHPAFRSDWRKQVPPKPARPPVAVPQSTEQNQQETEKESDDVAKFVKRIASATTHYLVLGVAYNATPPEIKGAYYELARRYHPDRFRQETDNTLKSRIDSAFARITQAYDTLSDVSLRASYDSKLDSLARAEDLAKEAPKATESHSSETPDTGQPVKVGEPNAPPTKLDVAEQQFKEGFAALQLGQLNVAVGLFASAARASPNESRYRAYYGHALSKNANSRRLAESELQAAVKLDPANADYRVMLAELYVELGFPVRAKAEVERALGRDPNHQKARELWRTFKPSA